MQGTELLEKIPSRDWDATPDSVRELVLSLLPLAEEVLSRQRVHRYHSLVDKQFLGDLTADEEAELNRLGVEIDASHAPFYQAVLERLKTAAG